MSKVVFNPVHDEKLQLLTEVSDIVTTDTRENILALTPDAGSLAYATDANRYYLYDGSDWLSFAIPLGVPTTDVDMGAIPFENDFGYGIRDLADKVLHKAIIADTDDDNGEPGMIRHDKINNKLQIYQDGGWEDVIVLTADEFDNLISYVDFDTYGKDHYGNDLIHGHQVDMGAFASEHHIKGREVT